MKFADRLRPIATAAFTTAVLVAALLAVILASEITQAARAAEAPQVLVKLGGKLLVPATAPLGVIATDPVLQQVLSQDFQVAGRLASASATSQFTLTVTLTQRALEPGMSLNDVAPGDSNAVALLKQAGVKPAPPPDDAASENNGGAVNADDTTAAEGNSEATNDVNSYRQQGQIQQPPASVGRPPPSSLMGLWPVPPATAQERSALAQQYRGAGRPAGTRSEQEASAIYDTIFVARATGGNDGSELTVVAVAHPGFHAREVRKLIAEEIANAVLH